MSLVQPSFRERERERESCSLARGGVRLKEIQILEGEKIDRIYEDNWDSTWTYNVVLRPRQKINR